MLNLNWIVIYNILYIVFGRWWDIFIFFCVYLISCVTNQDTTDLSLNLFKLFRFVTKLLEDLVFFVVDIPNSGQDVLEIMVNKPNRERQKLMREQNILKQVSLKPDLKLMINYLELLLKLFISIFRFSNFSKPLLPTVVMVPCYVWRSLETSDTLLLDIFAGFATEFCVIPSKITGRTR